MRHFLTSPNTHFLPLSHSHLFTCSPVYLVNISTSKVQEVFSGYLLPERPAVREPLPRVRKRFLHSDRGQDWNLCAWRLLSCFRTDVMPRYARHATRGCL
ncbi:hypothetical protein E2C01_070987 [Portunus trituberculatus]|uniref:Uncharacterized protein n=1 Tax=Portunus trituberculatus TaxID=210409 RepID=A0A5B7HU74_PORTR|nr:hypothetical protein [Portunus trituberculatus]